MRKTEHTNRACMYTLFILVSGFALYFSLYAIGRHHDLQSSAFDLGIFDQLVWNILDGRPLISTIEQVPNHWLLHQQPILYLVALTYLLAPKAETLLVVQVIAVAASAIPLYLISVKWTERPWVGLLTVLTYFMSPALEGVVLSDFHPLALAPLFLLCALYFIEEKHMALSVILLFLAVACKEDVALTVAATGLFTLLRRKDRRLFGTIVCISGAAVYLLRFAILSHFADVRNFFLWRYPDWFWPPSRLLATFWSEPHLVLSQVFAPLKVTYLVGLLAPFGFLPIFSPCVLLMGLPQVVLNLFSDFPTQYLFDSWHYSAIIAPYLALGSCNAIGVTLRWAGALPRKITVLTITILGIGSILGHHAYGYTPLAADFTFPSGGHHYQVVLEALSLIPPDAAVSAQSALLPHLSSRAAIYEYPNGIETVDYIVLDVSAAYYTFSNTAEYEASIEQLIAYESGNSAFSLRYARDGLLILQRKAHRDTADSISLDDTFYTYVVVDNLVERQGHPPTSFGPLELVGADFKLSRRGHIGGTLYWRALEMVPSTLRPAIALGRAEDELTAVHLQDMPFLHSTRPWEPGEVYRLTTGVSAWTNDCGDRWIYYAGVWDADAETWLSPLPGEDGAILNLIVDEQESYWVPLVVIENCWGRLSVREQYVASLQD